MTTTQYRSEPQASAIPGLIFLVAVCWFIVGFKTTLIVAAVVASVCLLCKLWELRPARTPKPVPAPSPIAARALEANSAAVTDVGEETDSSGTGTAEETAPVAEETDTPTESTAPVKEESDEDSDSSSTAPIEETVTSTEATAEGILGTFVPDEFERPSELTIDELVAEFDRIEAIDDEDQKDAELRALPFVTSAVFDAAISRIENRPPPRIISIETNRALGFLLSAFATEGSDYVATADIHRRESKNDDAIAELTPLQFGKRLGAWLAPTGITSEPLKPYIGGNRKGYVKAKVLAYVDAPGELEVRA